MSSVHGKTINGQTYYYLREVARIDGKPKIVSQRYLGKAEDIAAAMDAAAVLPTRTRHLAFGEVAATWSVLARLDVAGCIDEILGPRRADAAASVGTYLALGTDLTVVFDAGQNSASNFTDLADTGLGWVGSLPPSDHPALLAVPARRRRPVDPDRYPGLSAYETRTVALGAHRRVILTHSPTLHAAQARGFEQTLAKATRALTELADTLARGRTRRPKPAVQDAINQVTKDRWVTRVLTTELAGDTPDQLRLTFSIDRVARRALETEVFGKRILVTNRHDWPITEVVAAYRSQSEAESGFRQLKDPHTVGFSPMFHWTDSKIRVHLFTCVLALTVPHLRPRQAAQAWLHLSRRELLASLAGILETVLLYPSTGGRPKARRVLTDHDATATQLAAIFGLDLSLIHISAPRD